MVSKSSIEWTEHTWNPIVGCSIVSPGCTNCYAMAMAARIDKMTLSSHYEGLTKKVNGKQVWTGKLAFANDYIFTAPLRRKKPTTYFVNSMGDLFHEDAPDEWIDKVFAVMALCPQHTFQVLTKRAERMRQFFVSSRTMPAREAIGHTICNLGITSELPPHIRLAQAPWLAVSPWPLPNVWLGVSCERQQEADERIPLLLQTPAAVRFISAEPLLGPIDLTCRGCGTTSDAHPINCNDLRRAPLAGLDWVIIGGESGPNARPFHLEWADNLVEQCREARVACFVKQLGSAPMSSGYPHKLRDRKGGDPAEWPERLLIREMPYAVSRNAGQAA